MGNDAFTSSSKDYQDSTVIALAKMWLQACQMHFKNKKRAAAFTRFSKDENKNTKSVQEIIPDGTRGFLEKR